ncbi:MAG: c-type cytochrome [Candidatus Cyclobacteriaceae bacterium M2_1C_046]
MENYKKGIKTLVFFILIGSMAAVYTSCSVRKGVPYSEPVVLPTQDLEDGQVLFYSYCNTCHPSGTAGVGLAINNKPLPKFLIRFQVRHGLGVMPDFDEEVLKDEQVKKIAKYLVYLRKNG